MKFIVEKEKSSFSAGSVNLAVFADHSPSAHQGGLTLIMNDRRVATNGDIRFEPTPGQWQPTPMEMGKKLTDDEIEVSLHYPNDRDNLKGFNPIIYPDIVLDYKVVVTAEDDGLKISVNLLKPIPENMVGKVFFNFELSPVYLFGKPWIMDEKTGIFPRQANGPVENKDSYLSEGIYPSDGKASVEKLLGDTNKYNPAEAGKVLGEPYASGHTFTAYPDDEAHRFTIYSDEVINLYDGRITQNNGWFVLSSVIPGGKTTGAIEWKLYPYVSEDWRYTPVIQISQVGYHPGQPKIAVVELDNRDEEFADVSLFRITKSGPELVKMIKPIEAPKVLRYNYLQLDFSDIREEGLYRLEYKNIKSEIFRIAKDIYDRGVWQPVLEYFLPVQMCHMEVREKYRIWHGKCHMDDAYMAPTDFNHFDGYYQGEDTLTKFKPGDKVDGLNAGGWHDAGDFDLRIESQASEIYNLSLAYEEFGAYCDTSTVDQINHTVEIHQPDGKNDVLEQIEHGLLSVVGGYKALGRLYRGVICRDLRQYVLLGDAVNMTSGDGSDARWVFTENNPGRELSVAAELAASVRAMRDYSKELAEDTLSVAKELYDITDDSSSKLSKVHAAIELLITTGDEKYKKLISDNTDIICEGFEHFGWIAVRAIPYMDEEYKNKLRMACEKQVIKIKEEIGANPYGVPYKPIAWGSGWAVEAFGAHYYFLHKAFPDIFDNTPVFSALNFVLGTHPGSNNASYATGIGAKCSTTAYGANRADYSYIPGGVSSGTELIAPDLPEYLEFPFLWQQGEYVIGGGSSNYLLLVLAAKKLTENL